MDARSPEDIEYAACSGSSGWRCQKKKPVRFASAVAGTNLAWTVPTWFVDAIGGSDSNGCTSIATACKTWSEIASQRLGFVGGCAAPYLAQDVSITFVSRQSDADPMLWCPLMRNGSIASIRTVAASATPAVFTLHTALSTSLGANAVLSGSFAGVTPTQGMLLSNITHPSIAFAYKAIGGGNWDISQPFAPQSIPIDVGNAEVNTWASGDVVNAFMPIGVNLVMFVPVNADNDSALDNAGQILGVDIIAPASDGPLTNVTLGGAVTMSESVSHRTIVTGGYLNQAMGLITQNSALLGGAFTNGSFSTHIGGFVTTELAVDAIGDMALDGDIILGVDSFFAGGQGGISFARVSLDASVTVTAGSILFQNIYYSGHVTYATSSSSTANINFKRQSRGTLVSGSFTSGWTAPALAAGVLLNGSATACSHSGGSPDFINCGIATSATRLDAPQGSAGFGGTAFNLGGASVSNAL